MMKAAKWGTWFIIATAAYGQVRTFDRNWKEHRPVAKTTKWLGTTDTDWDVAGNWSNGIPATGDTVLVDSSAGKNLALNLDRTGDDTGAGLLLALFHVHETCEVNIGASGTPLRMCATKFINEGAANEVWFKSETGSTTQGTERIIQRGDGVFNYSSSGTGDDGQVSYVEITRGVGTLDFRSGAAVLGLFIVRHNTDPVVTIAGAASGISNIWMSGGDVEIEAATVLTITRFNLGGGSLTHTSGTITTLTQTAGVYYLDTTTAVGTVVGLRGVLNAPRTPGVKTINFFYYDPQGYAADVDEDLNTIEINYIGG